MGTSAGRTARTSCGRVERWPVLTHAPVVTARAVRAVQQERTQAGQTGSATLGVWLETADITELDDVPELGWLHRPRLGSIHVE